MDCISNPRPNVQEFPLTAEQVAALFDIQDQGDENQDADPAFGALQGQTVSVV